MVSRMGVYVKFVQVGDNAGGIAETETYGTKNCSQNAGTIVATRMVDKDHCRRMAIWIQ